MMMDGRGFRNTYFESKRSSRNDGQNKINEDKTGVSVLQV